MVYIYRKTIGEKPYYYLRVSERKAGKVLTKDIAYLGNSIKEVKKSLGNLSQYKESIRKAYKTIHRFLESNYFIEKVKNKKIKHDSVLGTSQIEVEACRLHFNSVFKKKDILTQQEIMKNFVIEFAFNTASIEGNTISLQEARNLLEDGLTPKNKTLREIYDLQNTERVFSQMSKKQKFNHKMVVDTHAMLMQNIDTRVGYRLHDVKVIKANFKSTPAPYIKADMQLLLTWLSDNKNLNPLVRATVFHHKFEKIHPFMDGNGRTGRMLLNFLLKASDYPPLIVHRKFRIDYLNALQNADKEELTSFSTKNYSDLIQFMANELTAHYWDYFL